MSKRMQAQQSCALRMTKHYAAFAKRMQTVFRKTYADTPCHKSNVNTRLTEGMQASSENLRFFTILAKSVQTHEHMRCTSRVCYHTARSARKCWHTSVQPSIPKLRSQERISVVSHQKNALTLSRQAWRRCHSHAHFAKAGSEISCKTLNKNPYTVVVLSFASQKRSWFAKDFSE